MGKKKKKFPQFVMVCSCMFATGVGKICFLKKNAVDHFFIPYVDDKLGNNEFIFQHDLVPPNTVKSTKERFREKRIPVFGWLTKSSDANQIENLWGILKEIKKILSIKS